MALPPNIQRPWVQLHNPVELSEQQQQIRENLKEFAPLFPVVNSIKKDTPIDFANMPQPERPFIPYDQRSDRTPIGAATFSWYMR